MDDPLLESTQGVVLLTLRFSRKVDYSEYISSDTVDEKQHIAAIREENEWQFSYVITS